MTNLINAGRELRRKQIEERGLYKLTKADLLELLLLTQADLDEANALRAAAERDMEVAASALVRIEHRMKLLATALQEGRATQAKGMDQMLAAMIINAVNHTRKEE